MSKSKHQTSIFRELQLHQPAPPLEIVLTPQCSLLHKEFFFYQLTSHGYSVMTNLPHLASLWLTVCQRSFFTLLFPLHTMCQTDMMYPKGKCAHDLLEEHQDSALIPKCI